MPTLIHSIPKYRKHWASGHAAVTLQGKEFYLGPWKSKASLVDYDRLIAEWLANGRQCRRRCGSGQSSLVPVGFLSQDHRLQVQGCDSLLSHRGKLAELFLLWILRLTTPR